MSPHTEGNVLIVDDDSGVVVLQRRRLERAGYVVHNAATPEEAVRQIDEGGVELIVLDYRLSSAVTGLEFFQQLKAAGYNLPVILVTGFSEEAVVVDALRAGVRDFVAKSAEYLDYLPEAVRRVLQQVRLEQQLAESEARLAGIIASAMDAIITIDEQERITLFNTAAERMFGRPAAEAVGQTIDLFLVGGFWASQPTDRALSWQGEVRGRRQNGETFPLELSVSPVKFDGRRFHTIIVRDITERHRAEERIREQAALLDQATDAIMVVDMDHRIRYWNQGAERLYGWSAAETRGLDPATFLQPGPATGPDATRAAARAEVLDKGEWSGELRQRTKNGGEVTVESRWTLVRDFLGRPKARLVINTDITAKKRLEAQYLRAQRMESLGTLAGGIAHDLNNALTPIVMAVDLLKLPMPEERRLSLLETLSVTAQRGAALVQQILSFARGADGNRVPLQLGPILKETQKLLEHSLPKSIRVTTTVAPDLWLITADPTHISQVLMNLCINARDAMPNGGQLGLSAANVVLDEPFIQLHPQAKGGPNVLLQVTDSGTGIPPDLIDKIFDPFFTTKEPGKGTGLGLATVLGIVKGSGGFVSVYSHPGQGTRFSVYLPARLSDRTRRAAAEKLDLPPSRGELVLVVDDEAGIREMARAALEAHGYRVLAAQNGAEALALHEQHAPAIDLVLLDMAMPQMDGMQTMQALLQRQAGLSIVAASGLTESNKPAGPGLGERAFLSKPYTAHQLLQTVYRVLHPEAGAPKNP